MKFKFVNWIKDGDERIEIYENLYLKDVAKKLNGHYSLYMMEGDVWELPEDDSHYVFQFFFPDRREDNGTLFYSGLTLERLHNLLNYYEGNLYLDRMYQDYAFGGDIGD